MGVFFRVWGLEEEAESRGPIRLARVVYWWVTVGVGAPGRVWGEFGTLGLRGWAGGDGGCQCCEFEVRPADFDWGVKLTPGFHLNGSE